jgi:hypothetical protein
METKKSTTPRPAHPDLTTPKLDHPNLETPIWLPLQLAQTPSTTQFSTLNPVTTPATPLVSYAEPSHHCDACSCWRDLIFMITVSLRLSSAFSLTVEVFLSYLNFGSGVFCIHLPEWIHLDVVWTLTQSRMETKKSTTPRPAHLHLNTPTWPSLTWPSQLGKPNLITAPTCTKSINNSTVNPVTTPATPLVRYAGPSHHCDACSC